MGKNYLDASQTMERMSSASTGTDYICITVPFDWEAVPGRPAAADSEIIDTPSLPLPPGRRPKDGFFLPFSRPAQSPTGLQNQEGGGTHLSHKERKPFSMKFSKKNLFRSPKQGRTHEDKDCIENTGGIFNPLSAHRFGSRISRRVLVESRKGSSCFGQCLPVGRKASSDHLRGRGLGSIGISNEDACYAASGSSPLSSPRGGHGKTRYTSIAGGAGKQLRSFRMASMLLALVSSESEESDKAEDTDGKSRTIVNDGRISKHLIPRATVSSSRKLQQVPGSDNSTNKSNETNTVPDCEGSVGDASSVSASSNRELHKGCRQSSFSWRSSDQVREKLDPLAAFLTVNVQKPGEVANERSGKISRDEGQGSCSSLVRNFSSRDSNGSLYLNYSTTNPEKNAVLGDPPASNMGLSTSCGSSDCSFITSSSFRSPQAEGERERPTLDYATRRYYSEHHSRPISSLPESPLQNQAAVQIDTLQALRVEDKKVPSNSIQWLEELKSSSLWPKGAQKIFSHGGAGDGESGYHYISKDFEQSSTDSFEYSTPRAGLSTPSMSSPDLRSVNTFPKPAMWVVSEELLKSSPLLQHKLQLQQSQESPRSSFMLDQETTIVPTLNTAFEQIKHRISVSAPILLTGHANSKDYGSKGENLAVSGLSETSESSSAKMNKAAVEESQDGVGSSGKSFPIYLRRRGSTIITSKAVSRCDSGDESGEDSDNSSSTDSLQQVPMLSWSSLIFCKFNISLELETRIVSAEVFKSSSSFQYKLQRQLKAMGLQTKPLDGANHIEYRSKGSFEDKALRAVSPTASLNSLVFCKVHVPLEPESWVTYVDVSEEELNP